MSKLFEKTIPTPSEEFVRVEWESLKRYVAEVLHSVDVPWKHAEIAADVLVVADLMGIESHGVQRVRRYTSGIKNGMIKPKTEIKI
ncbi:MAG: Ldh family oxidoreductase, partial [Desulfurococcaceae archaeon]